MTDKPDDDASPEAAETAVLDLEQRRRVAALGVARMILIRDSGVMFGRTAELMAGFDTGDLLRLAGWVLDGVDDPDLRPVGPPQRG